MRKPYLSDFSLGVLIPFLISSLLLHPLLLQSGVPFYGDETYYCVNPKSFYFNPFNYFFSWTPAYGLAPPFLTLFSYTIPLTSLTYLFGQEVAVKVFILIVAALPGILTYFASKILAKEWSLFDDKKKATIFAFVSGLFMLLAFTNFGLIGAGTAPTWSYVMLPLSFAFFVRYLKKGSSKDLLLLGLISLFALANPFWIYLMAIMGSLYIAIEICKSNSNKFTLIRRALFLIPIVLLFNAFWLMPTMVGYISGAGGLFQTYTTERLISFDELRFLSHWNLLDVVMVGEHSYSFFWLHPQNYGPLNAAIPILATISLLAFRKNRYALFMASVLIIGIFLTKGVHEPGGYLYYLIAKSIPYGAGAILRNPPKFVPLVNFAYAFLVSLTIAKFYEKLRSVKRCPKLLISLRLMNYGVTSGLMLLVLAPVTYGTLLDLQGYTWPRYEPTYVPEVYDELNSWLSKQPGDFKVMWIPSGGSYFWKPYIITAFPDLLSSRPAVSFHRVWPEPLKSTDTIGKVLTTLGVKYVIFHGDSLDYPNDEILSDLRKQGGLKPILHLTYAYPPENNSDAPLPRGQRIGEVPLEFENVPFLVMSDNKAFPRGEEINITLFYEIPDFIVEQGYKGKFWSEFSICLCVFPAGSVDLHKRVYESFVSEQEMIDEKTGYATFNVKVPHNYLGTAVDVYANIYDGEFKSLSPLYHIGRFKVEPSHIDVPFIVFENKEYRGPIYLSDAQTAHILSYKQLSPVEWEVSVKASAPFILVFTEPYDRLWRAYVNGKEIETIQIHNMVNGFPIRDVGTINIKIYYTLQNYFNVGLIISGISFSILALLFAYSLLKSRVKKFSLNEPSS